MSLNLKVKFFPHIMVMEKAVLQLFECSFVNKIVCKMWREREMTGNRPRAYIEFNEKLLAG